MALQRAVQEAEQRAAEEARQRKLAEEAEAARRTAEEARKRQEQEIVRLTREAAERASEETRRRIQEETRKQDAAADATQEKDTPQVKETTRIAALPKLPKPVPSVGTFNGTWHIVYSASSSKCRSPQGQLRINISRELVSTTTRGGSGSGRISPNGSIRWAAPSRFGPRIVDWSGTLRGNSGSGTYASRGGQCHGRFSASRG